MSYLSRDGQKRPVHIYRFLTAGTIDGALFLNISLPETDISSYHLEKIYQRQVTKIGLSNCEHSAEASISSLNIFFHSAYGHGN